MSSEAPTRRCWLRIFCACLEDELPHRFEVLLAAERGAGLALRREQLVQDVLSGDRGVVESRQEERRTALHSSVAGHQVFHRGALGVPEMQRTRHVRRRLDDHERRLGPVGARAVAVGIEDVGVEPALEDGMLDLRGTVSLCQLRLRPLPTCRLRRIGHCTLRIERPARPADERVVVPPAGSAAPVVGSSPTALMASPSRRDIGRLPHCSRATFAPVRLRDFQPRALRRGPRSLMAGWGRYSSRSSP